MAKARLGLGLLTGCLLLVGAVPHVKAAPTVEQMLQFRPKQAGVDYSTPTPDEQKQCEVKLVTGTKAGSSGWLLVDAHKRPLRRFFDSDGDKRIDVWSYFKDGLEVYREIDLNANNLPNEYRWLNSNGMRWGVDNNEDGLIDSWKEISAEEAAQEALQAVLTKDFRRLQALFVTEGELKSLNLPEEYLKRVHAKLEQAQTKFQQVIGHVPAGATAKRGRVEGATPECVPGESIGVDQDLYRYPTRTVLFEVGAKEHEWLQTGEMLKVGMAWRLLDVPHFGDLAVAQQPAQDPELQRLMEELAKLDQNAPEASGIPGPNPAIENYNRTRAAILEKMLPKVEEGQRASWIKQVADNLAAAATHAKKDDNTYLARLREYRDRAVQDQPNSALAGYLTFRVLWTEFAPKLSQPGPDVAKTQAEWHEKLAKFVETYPKADDTPDALLHLAMGSEFSGKEDDAKRWYQQLATNFPEHPLAPKSVGALRRLDLVGKKLELSGQTVSGSAFNIASLQGKVVIVYYWASYCTTCPGDFAKLKELEKTYGSKGLEIVTVNLDDEAQQAKTFLQNQSPPGVHLLSTGGPETGLSSPLSTQYGIIGLPTIFLVGKDGNVISRNIAITELAVAVPKAL